MARSTTRKELAEAAGVCVRTLSNWLESICDELEPMGYRRNMKVFTPRMAEYICRHFAIDPPWERGQKRDEVRR